MVGWLESSNGRGRGREKLEEFHFNAYVFAFENRSSLETSAVKLDFALDFFLKNALDFVEDVLDLSDLKDSDT